MLRAFLLLPAVAFLMAAGCRTTQPSDASAPPTGTRVAQAGVGDPLAIALGETVQHNGHSIRFVSVVEDSRCPVDVTCVWEGRAKVALTIDGTATTLTVPYGAQRDDEPSSLETGMIAVEVVGLDPYPGSPDAQAGAPVTLRVVTRHAGV